MLELRNISKIFPGVKALDDVTLSFQTGEIHALMGENGAGKSTLIKIITGIYQADLGGIYLDGQQVEMKSYRDAVEHDISMVSQEIQIIPEASVAENIVLDRLDKYSRHGHVDISTDARTELLTAAQKQLIQIAKALSANAKYILLDEPTSSLTSYESGNLIRLVKKLKEEGVGIIFVSHKIEEVLELCDVVSVIRDGKYVGTRECQGLKRAEIVKMMIGREEANEHLGFLDVGDETVLEVKHAVAYGKRRM